MQKLDSLTIKKLTKLTLPTNAVCVESRTELFIR